jgi:hypothetical protein
VVLFLLADANTSPQHKTTKNVRPFIISPLIRNTNENLKIKNIPSTVKNILQRSKNPSLNTYFFHISNNFDPLIVWADHG